MKLHDHNNNLITNVKDEANDFGIGNASVVIEILRNHLYENKIQTSVQEYICNARDAMREAGKPEHAFEITIPKENRNSVLNVHNSPTFKVRDYGNGITPDRMKNVFILYGASTKRSDNKQTGGFGIGAKSAWAYTDSFTIVSITDGIKRTYVAHTGVNKNGTLQLLTETPTNEPSGTEIQIPVKYQDIQAFENAAYRAVYFWNDRPKFINGECPQKPYTHKHGSLEIINEFNVDRNILNERFPIALIDGIPYSMNKFLSSSKFLRDLEDRVSKAMLIHFPNGILELSASRESIGDSSQSIQAIDSEAKLINDSITNSLKNEFKQATTVSDWVKVHQNNYNLFRTIDISPEFNDYKIDCDHTLSHVNFTHNKDFSSKVLISHITNKNQGEQRRNAPAKDPDKLYKDESRYIPTSCLQHIYYNSVKESTQLENRRIRELVKLHSKVVILEATTNGDDVLKQAIQDLNAIDLQTVIAPEKERKPKEKKQVAAEAFPMHCFGYPKIKNICLIDAENFGKTYLYFQYKRDDDNESYRELSEYVKRMGYEVVGLTDKIIDIVKDSASFLPIQKYLDQYTPSKDVINSVKYDHAAHTAFFQTLDGRKTKDPFVNEMSQKYKGIGSTGRAALPSLLKAKVMENPEVKDFILADNNFKEYYKKYPLVNFIAKHCFEDPKTILDEIVEYINSKV